MKNLTTQIGALALALLLNSNLSFGQPPATIEANYKPHIAGVVGVGINVPVAGSTFNNYYRPQTGAVAGVVFAMNKNYEVGLIFRTHRFDMLVDDYVVEQVDASYANAVLPFNGGDIKMKQFGINMGGKLPLLEGKVTPYASAGVGVLSMYKEPIKYSLLAVKAEWIVEDAVEHSTSYDLKVGTRVSLNDDVEAFIEYGYTTAAPEEVLQEKMAISQGAVGFVLKL